MKMTTIILTGLLLLIAAILIYATTKPDVYPIERSLLMKANPQTIFDNINHLKAWEAWTPYNEDGDVKNSYSGPENGPNATVSWSSTGKAGTGSMEITNAVAPTLVSIDLKMIKPFEVVNKVEFLIEPQQDQTKVTWRMKHHEPYPAKVFGIFMNMDNMVGKDFELGLARLKDVVEKQAASKKGNEESYVNR
jgi:hypothetical protein